MLVNNNVVNLYTILDELKATLDALMTDLLVTDISEKDLHLFNTNILSHQGLSFAFLNQFKESTDSYIYKIELVKDADIEKVETNYRIFNQTNALVNPEENKRFLEFNNTQSKVLYVGCQIGSLWEFIKAHLGYDNLRTNALHLKYWIPKDVKISITIFEIDSENATFIKFVKTGFWDQYKPMFGKRQNFY